MATNHTDELLDFVDENDQVIGQKPRSEIYAEHLNFRTVNGFVVNSKGEIWIPRRSATQRIFPECLDMSFAGHVKSGETYEDTLRRKLKKELNLDFNTSSVKELGFLSPQKDKVSSFMKVYEITMDETPDFNQEEFTEYIWLSPKALLEKIESGDQAKSDLPKLVEIFY